jgi:hypothetical protein
MPDAPLILCDDGGVVDHADRPTLVIRCASEDDSRAA